MKKHLIRDILLPIVLGIALVCFEIFISSGPNNRYKALGISMLAIILVSLLLLWITRTYLPCGMLILMNCGIIIIIIGIGIISNRGFGMNYDTVTIIAANWCSVTAVCVLARLIDRTGRLTSFDAFFKIASAVFFLFYIITLIYALFLKTPGGVGFMYSDVNLTPFKTILTYITKWEHYNLNIIVENLLGNILLFLPLGFYMQVLSGKFKLAARITIIFSVPLFVEVLQFITGRGSADIDDIILNFLGGLIGMALCKVIDSIYGKRVGDACGRLFQL